MEQNDIMVSVIVITYNHEKYVRHCLDSLLMQKTNFKYEILVHDDASPDGTADIIREYESKYPDVIHAIYQKENQYSQGKDISDYIYPKVKGKYLAHCEGDDYWVDENKLQKQVDYLEQNADIFAVSHRYYVVDQDEKILSVSHEGMEMNRLFGKKDALMLQNGLFHPNSVMYRASILSDKHYLEGKKKCCIVGSHTYMIFYFCTMSDIYIFDDIMSAWRYVPNGDTSFATRFVQHPITYPIISLDTTVRYRDFFQDHYDFDSMIAEKTFYTFVALLRAKEAGVNKIQQYGKVRSLTTVQDRLSAVSMMIKKVISRK